MKSTRTAFALLILLIAAFSGGQAFAGASMALQVGMQAGGELFRVVSPDPFGGTNYFTPDGRTLQAAEFRTTLDETVSFGLRVRVPIREKLAISGALTAADMDVTASGRAPSTHAAIELGYDQMFVMHLDVCAEYDWIAEGNRPFLAAGLGLLSLDFEEGNKQVAGSRSESLDQTKVALVVGGGFRIRTLAAMDFDLEARGYWISPDWSSEEERLVPADSFSGNDSIMLWQLGASVVYEF